MRAMSTADETPAGREHRPRHPGETQPLGWTHLPPASAGDPPIAIRPGHPLHQWATAGSVSAGPPDPAPTVRAQPSGLPAAESTITKVARGFAIARDAVVICLVVAALIVGGRVATAVSDATRGGFPVVPAVDPGLPCPTPTADEYGTYCLDTPGG